MPTPTPTPTPTTDTERLDALEDEDCTFFVQIQSQPDGNYIWRGSGKGLRQAIDQSLLAKEGE